jgi:hypothetical protein
MFDKLWRNINGKAYGYLSMTYYSSDQHKQDFSKRKRQTDNLSFSLESILRQEAKLRGDVHGKVYGFIAP